jgi:hypothetical protein
MQQKNRLRGSLGTLVLIISALPGARAIAQQVPITAFSPTANVQTFTPGFTGVGNLIPGPISLPPNYAHISRHRSNRLGLSAFRNVFRNPEQFQPKRLVRKHPRGLPRQRRHR